MGVGVFLVIIGAVLSFAVRRDTSVLDVQTTGLILMVAGAALIWWSQRERTREREVTTVDDLSDPSRPRRILHERVVEDGSDHPHP